jgi:tocopherol cyclase
VKPSYALIKVGCWGKDARQIHNFYGIEDFSCRPNELDLRISECVLTEKEMRGSCAVSEEESERHPEYMCGWGSMSWNLAIDKKIAFNVGYGASPLARSLNAFEMFWHAEGIKTEFSGEVTLDGRAYDVFPERSFGYSDKNWGADFTSPWLWISSCNMASLISGKALKDSAVEIGGGNPKVYGVSLGRKLLGGLYYEGKMHEYNFSKFWTGSRIDFGFEEHSERNEWTVSAINRDSMMDLVLQCAKDEMLLVNYEAPNEKKLHNRLWNGGTGSGEITLRYRKRGRWELVDHISVKNAGCEYGEYCEPSGRA